MRRTILFLCISAFVTGNTQAQKVAIKTNLLYWATGTPNAAIEIGTSSHITANLSIGYNALKLFGDASLRHFSVTPELHYWPCRTFERHFIGIHGSAGKFDIQNIPFIPALDKRAYNGTFYGGGVVYGYHWPLGTQLGIEAKIGAGYLYMDYNKYSCKRCDEFLAHKKLNYIGITSAGISIIYLIK